MFKFFLPVFSLGVIIFSGSLIAEFSGQKTYFSQQLTLIEDNEERLTVKWYIKYLNAQMIAQAAGIIISNLVIFFFFNEITDTIEGINPAFGYFTLCGIVSLVSWLIWKTGMDRRLDMNVVRKSDRRPPVLFLRSFQMDGKAPGNIYDLFDRSGKKSFTYERFALMYTSLVGPVVAIADPSDQGKLMISATTDTSDWQNDVTTLMAESSLIIFRPSNSIGIMWEFDQIIKNGHLHKTVLYVNLGGKNVDYNAISFEDFKNKVHERYNLELGEFDPKSPLYFFNEENDALDTFSYFDIPVFRKVFYRNYILLKKGNIRVS
ncbi:MAG: hypothetical protein V4685_13895 [Bacteroidota bacterium]